MGSDQLLWMYLWIMPHVLLLAIAALMFVRGLHREYPIFFSYVLFELLQFCVLFSLYLLKPPLAVYIKTDLLGRAGSIALRFGILQELFEAPLARSAVLRKIMAPFLNGATILLVLLALIFVGTLDHNIFGYLALKVYFTFQALNTAQCGLLALVLLWHGYLALRMSPMTFGIIVGMGLVVGSEPLVQALKGSAVISQWRTADLFQMAAFHLAVLVWLYFAAVREKVTAGDPANLMTVQRWAADLGRVTQL